MTKNFSRFSIAEWFGYEVTIRGTLKEVPYTVYTRYSWRWRQFQWKFLPKPSTKNTETTEKYTQEILRASTSTLKFESNEAVTDEMKTTRRPKFYVAPWKKSIKSIDKTNPTSSAIKFSSTHISVALTHIMAALIVLMS